MIHESKKMLPYIGISAALFILCCTGGTGNQGDKAMQQREIQEVQNSHTPDLMSIPGVVGTAIGERDGKLCIIVMVARKTKEIVKKIPKTLEGYPVIVQETGEFRALDGKR